MRLFYCILSLCLFFKLEGIMQTSSDLSFWMWQHNKELYQIRYIEKGSGDKNVLLIHGFAANTYTWRYIIDPLAKAGYHVWAIDLLGFGESDKPETAEYGLELYLDQILTFMNSKGISKASLIGNSMGGGVAATFTLRNEKRVNSLILIDAMGYPMELPFVLDASRLAPSIVKPFLSRFIIDASLKHIVYDKNSVTDQQVDAYWVPMTKPGGKEAFLKLLQTFDNETLKKLSLEFKHIKVPTLIIWGDADPLIPVSHAHKFKNDIPNSQLQIIERTGHIPQEEKPEIVIPLLINFLNKAYTS